MYAEGVYGMFKCYEMHLGLRLSSVYCRRHRPLLRCSDSLTAMPLFTHLYLLSKVIYSSFTQLSRVFVAHRILRVRKSYECD
jgi:hypothetical protein